MNRAQRRNKNFRPHQSAQPIRVPVDNTPAQVKIGITRDAGGVRVEFSQSVRWIRMGSADALSIALAITEAAQPVAPITPE